MELISPSPINSTVPLDSGPDRITQLQIQIENQRKLLEKLTKSEEVFVIENVKLTSSTQEKPGLINTEPPSNENVHQTKPFLTDTDLELQAIDEKLMQLEKEMTNTSSNEQKISQNNQEKLQQEFSDNDKLLSSPTQSPFTTRIDTQTSLEQEHAILREQEDIQFELTNKQKTISQLRNVVESAEKKLEENINLQVLEVNKKETVFLRKKNELNEKRKELKISESEGKNVAQMLKVLEQKDQVLIQLLNQLKDEKSQEKSKFSSEEARISQEKDNLAALIKEENKLAIKHKNITEKLNTFRNSGFSTGVLESSKNISNSEDLSELQPLRDKIKQLELNEAQLLKNIDNLSEKGHEENSQILQKESLLFQRDEVLKNKEFDTKLKEQEAYFESQREELLRKSNEITDMQAQIKKIHEETRLRQEEIQTMETNYLQKEDMNRIREEELLERERKLIEKEQELSIVDKTESNFNESDQIDDLDKEIQKMEEKRDKLENELAEINNNKDAFLEREKSIIAKELHYDNLEKCLKEKKLENEALKVVPPPPPSSGASDLHNIEPPPPVRNSHLPPPPASRRLISAVDDNSKSEVKSFQNPPKSNIVQNREAKESEKPVPQWMQELKNQKKAKQPENSDSEADKLANLPEWKRELILRKQANQADKD